MIFYRAYSYRLVHVRGGIYHTAGKRSMLGDVFSDTPINSQRINHIVDRDNQNIWSGVLRLRGTVSGIALHGQ